MNICEIIFKKNRELRSEHQLCQFEASWLGSKWYFQVSRNGYSERCCYVNHYYDSKDRRMPCRVVKHRVAFSDTEVLGSTRRWCDGGKGDNAVKDRSGGATALYAGCCLKSLGLWCQHSIEDRTRFDTEHSPWVKECSLSNSPHGSHKENQ
jgi:hypothetical protein